MSLAAQAGAIETALIRVKAPFQIFLNKSGARDHFFVEFPFCPICKGGKQSLLTMWEDGRADFGCAECDCTSAESVLRLLNLNWNKPVLKVIEPVDYEKFALVHSSDREIIVDGILRRQETINITGPSKAKKSLFVSQLALSVAMEQKFLGKFPTHSLGGKVLIADYELFPDSIRRRVDRQIGALSLHEDVGRRLHVHSMRGSDYLDLDQLCSWLELIEPRRYSIVIIDALYRATPEGFNENSNADVTRLYNRIDRAAAAHGCSFVVVHHFSKGSQADKAVADLGAGAGAQSRAADAHIALREHARENHVIISGIVRDFPPLEEITIACQWPLWHYVPDVDPADRARHPSVDYAEVAAVLPAGETLKRAAPAMIHLRLQVSLKEAERQIARAVDAGLITEVRGSGSIPSKLVVSPEQAVKIAQRLSELSAPRLTLKESA